MGFVKFKGNLIYQGDMAEFVINPNWCNSMQEYYPFVYLKYVDGGGEIRTKSLDIPAFRDIRDQSQFEYVCDEVQVLSLQSLKRKSEEEREAKIVRVHKVVRVVRGRKVPIGTVGEVFWMGDKGYGMAVGIRLIDDKRVFTALKNVECASADELFEKDLLGENE